MKKLYGSLDNRLAENRYFNNTEGNIQVGTLATKYYYSDRAPYEVVDVIDQKHIFIRKLRAIRIDNNGMSECQEYRYESDETGAKTELELTKYGWKEVRRYSKETYDAIMKRDGFVLWSKELYNKVVVEGKKVKKTFKIDISFGIAEKYYDYSF